MNKNTKHNYFAIIGTALFVALIALATVPGYFQYYSDVSYDYAERKSDYE